MGPNSALQGRLKQEPVTKPGQRLLQEKEEAAKELFSSCDAAEIARWWRMI